MIPKVSDERDWWREDEEDQVKAMISSSPLDIWIGSAAKVISSLGI
jgi:hypothetical protein